MELDQRKLRILRAIIDEYILSANPVGSKSISRNPELGWSSATIRNEMADLELLGYLAQPHTSAGRIPSDKAYRLYVDQMLRKAHLTEREMRVLDRYYQSRISGVESVLWSTAEALSDITNYTAVVLMPELSVNRLKHIQLVPITEGKALAVIVTDAGVASDTVIDIPKDMTGEELERLSRIITTCCYNCRMATVAERIRQELNRELRTRANFLEQVFEAIRERADDGTARVALSGAKNMLHYPEYSDVNKAKAFLSTVEQRDAMYRMLKKASVMEFTITIGQENEPEGFKDCSVVTASYRVNEVPFGTFGIIGPTRMDYNHVVSVMEGALLNMGQILQSMLKED